MAGDAQFHAWQNDFVTYVNDHLADLGLEEADVVDLNDSAATRTTDCPAHTVTQTAPILPCGTPTTRPWPEKP